MAPLVHVRYGSLLRSFRAFTKKQVGTGSTPLQARSRCPGPPRERTRRAYGAHVSGEPPSYSSPRLTRHEKVRPLGRNSSWEQVPLGKTHLQNGGRRDEAAVARRRGMHSSSVLYGAYNSDIPSDGRVRCSKPAAAWLGCPPRLSPSANHARQCDVSLHG